MHDPRVGRFFATDPLSHKYPHYSPYSFGGNKVIEAIELEGAEEKIVWYANNAEKPTTLLKLSDKNTNWASSQISNYHIVNSLDEAGLVTWSYGKGQYHQSNRIDGSMYSDGVWNGPTRGTLMIREINGRYIVAFDSKSLGLKQNKDYDWEPVKKGIKTFNPIYPVSDPLIDGSEKYKNTVNNYKTAILVPIAAEGLAIKAVTNFDKVEKVGTILSLIVDADELAGGGDSQQSLIESQLATKEQKQVFNAVKFAIDSIARFYSINNLGNSSGGTEIVKGTADALKGTTDVINDLEGVKN